MQLTCLFEGCDRDGNEARGLCNMHYQQERKAGNLRAGPRHRRSQPATVW